MFRRIVFVAALAGLIAGLVASGVQALRVVPLIHAAEVFEAAAPTMPTGHHHDDEGWAPAEGMERVGLTVVANVLVGIGFGFLLASAFTLTGKADWRRGLLWGAAGFATFTLAPSLGLPPEVPGAAAGPLADRQLWWIGTVAATAIGLALVVFPRRWPLALLGVALIAAPHLIGAPPAVGEGSAPAALARDFIIAALVASLLFWLALGAAAGFFFRRFSAA